MNLAYLFTGFNGRIGRQTFWSGLAILIVTEIVVHRAIDSLFNERMTAIVDLAFAYPEFALLGKRAQDRDLPLILVGGFLGMSVLMNFLSLIGLAGTPDQPASPYMVLVLLWLVYAVALLIDLGFRRGTPGPNRHGPDPLQTPT
jgi:uncharacterized membrane protein YhaH (DUF805 family)